MDLSDVLENGCYVVYSIDRNGDKFLYMHNDTCPFINGEQLETVKANLKRQGFDCEVRKVEMVMSHPIL